MLVIVLLYIWRPREWPQFFTLDVPNDPQIEGLFPNAAFFNLEPRREIVLSKLGKATIRDSLFDTDKKRRSSCWSEGTSFYSDSDPFVIVDPMVPSNVFMTSAMKGVFEFTPYQESIALNDTSKDALAKARQMQIYKQVNIGFKH